jgi:transcription initiation factor TFIIIB Brf1 subunit/transcription initiation factor TFIIB
VVGIRPGLCTIGEYLEVSSQKNVLHSRSSQLHVCSEVDEVLRSGGICSLKVKRLAKSMICTECRSDDLVEVMDRGDIVCNNCAVVHRSRLAFVGIYNTYATDACFTKADNVTVGSCVFIEKEDTCTSFLTAPIVSEKSSHQNIYAKIDSMCDKLYLNSFIAVEAKEEINAFFKESSRVGGMKLPSKPVEALVASCILVACRIKGNARTLKEILAICSCTKKQLSKVLKGVNRVVSDIMRRVSDGNTTIEVIPRFCSNLGVSQHISLVAVQVALEIERRGICASRVSSSVAASAILVACVVCDGNISGNVTNIFSAVSAASGAAEATIKEVCKILYRHRGLILPSMYIHRDLSVLVSR